MAKLLGDAIIPEKSMPIPAGSEVTIVKPVSNAYDRFEIKWSLPSGPISGSIATGMLDLTKQEIAIHEIPTDRNGLPLYKNLSVRYIGPTNETVSQGDGLIVLAPWYNGDKVECQCLNGNSKPNTDGRVVVKTNLLERR